MNDLGSLFEPRPFTSLERREDPLSRGHPNPTYFGYLSGVGFCLAIAKRSSGLLQPEAFEDLPATASYRVAMSPRKAAA